MIIGCCGLQGSASTWTYNVVQEIVRRSGKSLLAGSVENLPALGSIDLSKIDTLVIKAHCMHHQMVDILNLSKSRVLVSYRNPIACAISLHSRILEDQNDAIKNVVRSFASVSSIINYTNCFHLDFGDDFAAKLDTLVAIAEYIGEELSKSSAQDVFGRFKKDTLSEFFTNTRKSDEMLSNGFHFDPVTLFNENHITQQSKHFNDSHSAELERLFGGLHRRDLKLVAGDLMTFSERVFCFDSAWPRREGPGLKILNSVYLPRGLWSIRIVGKLDDARISSVIVCQSGQVIAQLPTSGRFEVDVAFRFENLCFDDDIQVFLDGDLPFSFETDRPDCFQIEARLVSLVAKATPAS